jgi:lysozyme
MRINDKGIALIKSFEGCKLKAYQDSVGIWTVGYGATFYQDGSKVKSGDTLTQQQADELLNYHVDLFAEKVKPLIKGELSDNQFSALVSFAFNLGAGALSKSTLLKKVNANPEDESIRAEFAKWDKAGGKQLRGLTRRRKAEADLYFSI